MLDLNKLKEEIMDNKKKKGFNITDINLEFCLAYGELAETYEAYRKNKDDLGEEFADVMIYLLGLCSMLNIDIESEILNKLEKNKNRVYKKINGVNIKVGK